MEILREELLTCQRHRNDLHRWKILVVSVLSGVAIGVRSTTFNFPELILVLVPLMCIYIDLLYYHDGIVINVLGSFMRLDFEKLDREDSNKVIFLYEHYTMAMRLTVVRDQNHNKAAMFNKKFSFDSIVKSTAVIKLVYVLFNVCTAIFICVSMGQVQEVIRGCYPRSSSYMECIIQNASANLTCIVVVHIFVLVLLFLQVYIIYRKRKGEDYSVYQLEKSATFFATALISFLVLIFPYSQLNHLEALNATYYFIVVSGIIGLALSTYIYDSYNDRRTTTRDFLYRLQKEMDIPNDLKLTYRQKAQLHISWGILRCALKGDCNVK